MKLSALSSMVLGLVMASVVWASEELPAHVYIKTPTRTFNSRNYFALKDGRIWFKANEEVTGRVENWRLFGDDGLPGNPGFLFFPSGYPRPTRIDAIYADADELLAIDNTGLFHLKTAKSKSAGSDDLWHEIWGFPKTDVLKHTPLSRRARAISLGRRHGDALWHEDMSGNAHHYGTMGTTTIYVLDESGRRVMYTDNGLPVDFSHSVCLPERGRFVAENMAASASVLFVVDKYGNMRTHLEDFDLNGGAAIFYDYSYGPVRDFGLAGTDLESTNTTRKLPLDDWNGQWDQPRIKLEGKARLTKDITILQTGHGNAERELRVAGLNKDGVPGYYSKKIFAPEWEFMVREDVELNASRFLNDDDVRNPDLLDLARSDDDRYEGTIEVPGIGTLKATLVDFNLDCSPAQLLITDRTGTKTFEAKLHTVEAWSFMKRHDPGRDGTPKLMYGTLEVTNVEQAPLELRNRDLDSFRFSIRASKDYIEVREVNVPDGVQIKGKFARHGLDREISFPGLDATLAETYGIISPAGIDQLSSDPELCLSYVDGKCVDDLSKLIPRDLPRLRAKIELNKLMRTKIGKMMDRQAKELQTNGVLAALVTNLQGTVLSTKVGEIAGIEPLFRRGSQMLRMYGSVGKEMFNNSSAAWKRADQMLGDRIGRYEARVEELRRQLLEDARKRNRRGN